jgi:hypothetical protein
MSRIDLKFEELKKYAQIIVESEEKAVAIQRMNGLRMGLANRHGKTVRGDIWARLIKAYR